MSVRQRPELQRRHKQNQSSSRRQVMSLSEFSAETTFNSRNPSIPSVNEESKEDIDQLLASIILLDNSPGSFNLQPQNGFPAVEWINDPSDQGLLDLLPCLDALRYVSDVRHILSLRAFDERSYHRRDFTKL